MPCTDKNMKPIPGDIGCRQCWSFAVLYLPSSQRRREGMPSPQAHPQSVIQRTGFQPRVTLVVIRWNGRPLSPSPRLPRNAFLPQLLLRNPPQLIHPRRKVNLPPLLTRTTRLLARLGPQAGCHARLLDLPHRVFVQALQVLRQYRACGGREVAGDFGLAVAGPRQRFVPLVRVFLLRDCGRSRNAQKPLSPIANRRPPDGLIASTCIAQSIEWT